MKRKGFTLIELLVVISIIAMLLSILMPSLARAREAARGVVCRTNLKQLYTGTHLYAMDYRHKLPSAAPFSETYNPYGTGTWYNGDREGAAMYTVLRDGTRRIFPGIGRYVDLSLEYNPVQNNMTPQPGSVVQCPSLPKTSYDDVFPSGMSYGMNFEFSLWGVDEIRRPDSKVLFADATWYYFSYDRVSTGWAAGGHACSNMWNVMRTTEIPASGNVYSATTGPEVLVLPGRHGRTSGRQDAGSMAGALNFLFADGHVVSMNREELNEQVRGGANAVQNWRGTQMIDNGLSYRNREERYVNY